MPCCCVFCFLHIHYNDVIMGAIASQITSLTIVFSTFYSDPDQRKHQSSAPLAFVRGIHRGPVNSLHKWPVTRKMFPFDDVIMRIYPLMLLRCYWGNHTMGPVRVKQTIINWMNNSHDDVMKWKHLPRYWLFVRSPVNSPHKGHWRGALIFSLICSWINGWINNREAGDLRRHRANYGVPVMTRFH